MKEQIKEKVQEYLEIAREEYPELPIVDIPVYFDLKSVTTAGQYRLSKGKHFLRFNLHYMKIEENREMFFEDLIPHEVAHYITTLLEIKNLKHHKMNKHYKKLYRDHGTVWQYVMSIFGIVNAKRCHSMIAPKIEDKKNRYRFIYKCNCDEHKLTSYRHKQLQKNPNYYVCKNCETTLKFSHEEI